MINKEQLIKEIYAAFQDVKLENGIGLWEAQGHDDRLTIDECKQLRKKDEKEDWSKIPVIDLYRCESSLSFFDAKGMQFHLPIFLLFALDHFEEENELHSKGLLKPYFTPDVEIHLLSGLSYVNSEDEMSKMMRDYNNEQFSMLNTSQIDCIIEFLRFRMGEMKEYYNSKYAKEFGTSPMPVKYDKGYIELEKGVKYWKEKLSTANNV